MRHTWLADPSLIERNPAPPILDGPFFVAEPRGDAPSQPPFTADPYALEVPAPPRAPAGRPSLTRGDQVREALLRWPDWRLLADVPSSFPMRIYEVDRIDGLRWERFEGRGPWQLRYDRASVVREIPGHAVFGENGAAVAQVLEGIATLDPELVRALPEPPPRPRFQLPLDRVTVPEEHPFAEPARRATSAAISWTEARGWAVDPEAGSHYYHGCYFDYSLHDARWLSALARGINAATLAAVGGDLPESERARIRAEWADLGMRDPIGDPA